MLKIYWVTFEVLIIKNWRLELLFLLLNFSVRGTLSGLSHDLEELWRLELNASIFSSLCMKDEKVIFGSHDNHVYCVDINVGRVLWKSNHSSPVFGTPYVAGNVVVSMSTKGSVKLNNLISGEDIFQHSISSSDFFSSPVVIEDTLIVGSRNNQLYCLKFIWKLHNSFVFISYIVLEIDAHVENG